MRRRMDTASLGLGLQSGACALTTRLCASLAFQGEVKRGKF
ncbi:hypothetical protein ACFOEY_00950 [Paracandidimonas soli]